MNLQRLTCVLLLPLALGAVPAAFAADPNDPDDIITNCPASLNEGASTSFTITPPEALGYPCTLTVRIVPGSALPVTSGLVWTTGDYTLPDGVPGDFDFEKLIKSSRSFSFSTIADTQPELDENFYIQVLYEGTLIAYQEVTIIDNDDGGILSQVPGADDVIPIFDPSREHGRIQVNIIPNDEPKVGWRFVGETEWRAPGDYDTTMLLERTGETGFAAHEIEFRPVPGLIEPAPRQVVFTSSKDPIITEGTYQKNNNNGRGVLVIDLYPAAAAGGRWFLRFVDEDRNGFDDSFQSGDKIGLQAGNYEVYFEPVSGYETPRPRMVTVVENQTARVECTYHDLPVSGDPDDNPLQKFNYTDPKFQPAGLQATGQVRSNIAQATGVAVGSHCVLTTAQAVYNTKRLAFSYKIRWSLQRQKGANNPPPQLTRGLYIFNNYSAALAGSSTPGELGLSALDTSVAALYFTEPCARGGFAGYIGAGAGRTSILQSSLRKTLTGYALSTDTDPEAQSGIDGYLYTSDPNFTGEFGPVDGTSLYRSPSFSNVLDGKPVGSLLGSPLFTYDSKSSLHIPSGILVGAGDFGGGPVLLFRAFEEELAELVQRANFSGETDQFLPHATGFTVGPVKRGFSATGGLGGGFGGTESKGFDTESTTGSLRIHLSPSAADSNGAWSLYGNTYNSGATANDLIDGSHDPSFSAVTGYEPPAVRSVTVVAEQTAEVTKDYSANSYTVTYDAEGGTVSQSGKMVTYQSTYGTLATPTRTGYIFGGWWNGDNGTGTQISSGTTVTTASNHTLYAKWTINSYTLTFDSNGGSAIDPITQQYNTTIIPPVDPTRAGYTFDGWSPSLPAKMPAGNQTLTAQWTANVPQWTQDKFPEEFWNDPAVIGPEANPDGDPYNNTLERALGGDPLAGDALVSLTAANQTLSISFTPDRNQTDITLTIHAGASPADLQPVVTSVGMGDFSSTNGKVVVDQSNPPIVKISDHSGGTARFMKIEATSSE